VYKPLKQDLIFFPQDAQEEIIEWALEHNVQVKDEHVMYGSYSADYKSLYFTSSEDELAFRLRYLEYFV